MRRKLISAVGMVVACYVVTYFALMIRDCSAVKDGVPKFRSCYRWAPDADIRASPITITVGKVTPLNYLFYPMDLVYYTIADSFR